MMAELVQLMISQFIHVDPSATQMPNHHFKVTSNSLDSRWDCHPGEGITDTQAEAWGDHTESRQALSGMKAEL